MPYFRKKPIVIEAVQFTGNNCIDCLIFMGEKDAFCEELQNSDSPVVHTLEGNITASPGDWIIKGVKGEFYPCKTDIFQLSYEEVV